MDMTLNEFENLTNVCWDKKYNPFTVDMTKDKYTGRYRPELDSIFVPDTSPFENLSLINEYLFECNRKRFR